VRVLRQRPSGLGAVVHHGFFSSVTDYVRGWFCVLVKFAREVRGVLEGGGLR
jgi:hypothetical protein